MPGRVLQLRGHVQRELALAREQLPQRLWQLQLEGLAGMGPDDEGACLQLDQPLARGHGLVGLTRQTACYDEAV